MRRYCGNALVQYGLDRATLPGSITQDLAMLTRTADEVPIWWEQIGAGPAVVLLPGRGDSSDLFPSILVDRLLSAGLSVIRMDPRDTGLSDDGGDEYTLSTLADDVVAVLGAAEVDRAHIEAVSMGGMITVDLVSRFPDRVLSSVFIAAMSPDPEGGIGPDFFTPLEGASPAEMILALMSSPNETKTGTGWTRSSIEVGAGRRRDRKTGSVTWRRHSGSAGAPLLTYSLTSKSPPYSDDRWNPPDHTHRWLHGQWRTDPKTTSSVYATARDAVWPWGNPMVRASAATCEIDLDWLTSGSNTMYLCARRSAIANSASCSRRSCRT